MILGVHKRVRVGRSFPAPAGLGCGGNADSGFPPEPDPIASLVAGLKLMQIFRQQDVRSVGDQLILPRTPSALNLAIPNAHTHVVSGNWGAVTCLLICL
jgi:hypothetical protein